MENYMNEHANFDSILKNRIHNVTLTPETIPTGKQPVNTGQVGFYWLLQPQSQTARGLRNKPPKQALRLGERGTPKYRYFEEYSLLARAATQSGRNFRAFRCPATSIFRTGGSDPNWTLVSLFPTTQRDIPNHSSIHQWVTSVSQTSLQ
jgi:hypothetical protein